MIINGNKNRFSLTNPKFGVLGYNIQKTETVEPLYKVRNIGVSKKPVRDNYMDEYLKQMKFKKGSQYNVSFDWTKQKKGTFLKGPKVSFTEGVI